jgi:phosphoglycerate kinase
MEIKKLNDLKVDGKKVLIRVDFNVPMDAKGHISDSSRIEAAIPTLKELLQHNAALILMSHLGRPEGKVVESLSLRPLVATLSKLLGSPVHFVHDCVGPLVADAVKELQPGEVLLLENLRFHPEEELNVAEFAASLASVADVYVNDAFGTAHRAHASTEGVARILPSAAGRLMEAEFNFLGKMMEAPKRPFTAIVGGAKVSTKIDVLENLIEKVDNLLIGGAMAFTFIKAQGINVAASKTEDDKLELARKIMVKAVDKGVTFMLPCDCVAAAAFDDKAPRGIYPMGEMPAGWMGLDVGPATVKNFSEIISKSATVLWNGPLGVFEMEPFAEGTKGIGEAIAASNAESIVGGGDSVAAVHQFHLADQMTHISTGGGASLEMIEGKLLPGIAVLLK